MSFNRASALESQSSTLSQDDSQYVDDPEFERLTRTLSDKLSTLTNNISQLSRQVELLGTRRETERVRERVQDLVEETGTGFKYVGNELKAVAAWQDLGPQQKYIQNRLNTDFRSSISEFQLLQRRALEKQRAARTALEQDSSQAGISQQQQGGSSAQPGGGQQLQQLEQSTPQQQQQQQQSRLAPQSDVDFQGSLIIEREQEIRQIEQSVGELNELFRDVSSMVHEQGFMVDTIAENVENTREDTRGANTELRSAERYQKRARSRACCLLLILAVVMVVVILAGIYG